jgi:hypothetical protein
MADAKDVNVNVRVTNKDDEELAAGSIKKGEAYPKGESKDEPEKSEPKKTASKRPPKGLLKDQFSPDDGHNHQSGGWAIFEYPAPDDIEPSVERVREHVEDRVRRAGHEIDGEVVAYDKDDDNFRVAVRYK